MTSPGSRGRGRGVAPAGRARPARRAGPGPARDTGARRTTASGEREWPWCGTRWRLPAGHRRPAMAVTAAQVRRPSSPQRDTRGHENSLDGVAFLAAPKAGYRARNGAGNGHGQGQGQGNGAKCGHGADAGARHECEPNRGPAPHGQRCARRTARTRAARLAERPGRTHRWRGAPRWRAEGASFGARRRQPPACLPRRRPRQQPHPVTRGPRPKWRQNRQRRPEASSHARDRDRRSPWRVRNPTAKPSS